MFSAAAEKLVSVPDRTSGYFGVLAAYFGDHSE